jgi:hypothetical protein
MLIDKPLIDTYNPNYIINCSCGGELMGQVTIYLDKEIENKLKKAAKSSRLSVSKWVAGVIEEKIMTEWPQDVVELAGSWKDDFPTLEEIRSNISHDSMREEL